MPICDSRSHSKVGFWSPLRPQLRDRGWHGVLGSTLLLISYDLKWVIWEIQEVNDLGCSAVERKVNELTDKAIKIALTLYTVQDVENYTAKLYGCHSTYLCEEFLLDLVWDPVDQVYSWTIDLGQYYCI